MLKFDNLPFDPGTLLLLSKIQIDFVFQPVFHMRSQRIVAHEALIRSNDLAPETIIDEFEATNKMHILELATFFGATKRFYERGYKERLCINSFASELLSSKEEELFFSLFPRDLSRRLVVELLDHTVYSPLTWQIKREQLRSHNVRIALDDFSYGYNHHPAFNIFEPDFVKLDRCFIEGIDTSRRKQERYRDMVEYIHDMGAEVLAEGVETAAEYEYIQKTDTDYVQGFYLAKPE